jgi:large subunit ribosomal protein L17
MKHNIKFSRLSRDSKHRKALTKNLSMAILLYKQIYTTKAKSEAAIMLINKVIKKVKLLKDYRQKVYLIKKHIVNQNRESVATILTNIDELSDTSNYISRISFMSFRSDSANMVRLKLI